MKSLLLAAALGVALFSQTGQALKPALGRPALEGGERYVNGRISGLWPEDPYLLLGTARGIYLPGYGAVFTAEIDLAPGPSLNPFHQVMTKQNIADNHQKMTARLPKLREAMMDMLAATAISLEALPPDERVVLGVTLTKSSWQDRTGVPSQLVMSGFKGKLTEAKRAGQIQGAVTVEEF